MESPSDRSHGPAHGAFAAVRRALTPLAWVVLGSLAWGQFGTVQRETKLSSVSGGFSGPLGNDFRFGVSVAELGDFDGDGVRDLAVGSHRADLGGPERGAIWLLLMNPDGTVREHHQISDLAGGLAAPLDDHDRFGISICSLGDLDLDGTVDLAVGTYRDDDGALDAGCVYVLFLNPDGSVKAQQKISELEGGLGVDLQTEDSFGWSVENIGDLDQDGVVDLAVGATRDDGVDTDMTRDFGAVYLLFLNPDGSVKAHALIDTQAGALGAALRPRDRFGADVVLLDDADGDGVQDIAVGAFGEDPLKTGKVFVLHLTRVGEVKSFTEIGPGTGGFTGQLGKGDRFGISLAADDFDGDGLQDLVVGAAGDDDGGAEAGCVWVCLLNSAGRVRALQKISPDFGGFGGLLHPGDNFGISCTVLGDLDRDGAVDLAVGAYQDDDGGFDRGAAWLLFRSGTGAPVADFAATPNAGEAPLTVTFGDLSSGAVSAWLWDFGDGSTSSEATPVHVYSVPGVRDVTLTVTGPMGSDVLLRQRAVVAQPPRTPSANFVCAPESGVAPLAVAFSDLSTGSISSWSWDFGDGTFASQRQPKHVYATPGVYTVSLTVAGSAGTSNLTVLDEVTVLDPPPVADFAANPLSGFPPLDVGFSDLSTPDVTSWSWDFGDGATSTERAPVHTYVGVGAYAVTLSVSGPTGTDVLARPAFVQVLEPITAGFTLAPSGSTAPVTVQFTDTSTGPVTSWSWDFGDGTTSALRNPSHVFDHGATFDVRLSVDGPGPADALTQSLTILEPPPVARFTATPRSGNFPLRVEFHDGSLGNVTSWLWDFGDGTGSTERNPVHVYRLPGTYTVRYRVFSAGGFNGLIRRDYIQVDYLPHRGLGILTGNTLLPLGVPPF